MEAQRILALVGEAEKAVAGDAPHEHDQLVVCLWKRVLEQNTEIDKLKADVTEAQQSAAHHYHRHDILASQFLKQATGTTKVDAETLVRGLSHA